MAGVTLIRRCAHPSGVFHGDFPPDKSGFPVAPFGCFSWQLSSRQVGIPCRTLRVFSWQLSSTSQASPVFMLPIRVFPFSPHQLAGEGGSTQAVSMRSTRPRPTSCHRRRGHGIAAARSAYRRTRFLRRYNSPSPFRSRADTALHPEPCPT